MADKKEQKQPGWKNIPIGGMIIEAGNAKKYQTGGWGAFKPIWHPERCTHCLLCWVSCPDASILVKDGKIVGVDYEHCKGCGICPQVCPLKIKAMTMEKK